MSVCLSVCCVQEATHVSETQCCSPPVQITQLSQGKPFEVMKFGLSHATQPQSFHCRHRDGQPCQVSVGRRQLPGVAGTKPPPPPRVLPTTSQPNTVCSHHRPGWG